MRTKIMAWLTWGTAVIVSSLLALIVIVLLARILRWLLAGL